MGLRKFLAKVLFLGVLELGALCGVPIRPDQIEDLLRLHNQASIRHVIRNEDDEPLDKKK